MLWLLACTGRPTVAIVGAGPAGLAAAIEAATDADVVLYEGEDVVGGSARFAKAITTLDLPGERASPTRYRDRVEPMVIEWTTGLGVSWAPAPGSTDEEPLLWPHGGGPALVGALERQVRALGVELRLGQRVTELPKADAVIVATGGIMGDVEAFRAWAGLPPGRLLRGAPKHADGQGWSLMPQAAFNEPRWLVYPHGTPGPEGVARMVLGADGLPLNEGGELQGPRGDQGNAWALTPSEHTLTVATPGKVALLDWEMGRSEAFSTGTLELYPTTAKTLSGVKTDVQGRVRNDAGRHIPGLYAAGEVNGFHDAYAEHVVDSTMVAGAILAGRVTAQAVLSDL